MAQKYKNPGRIEFVGVIERTEGGGAFVEFPYDVEAAYKKAKVLERYRAMSYSHQRERNLWIEDAKQDETRKRRIAKSVEELRKRKA